MSCYLLNPSETTITIPSYETIDNVTFYLIKVTCWQGIEWTVRHRYSDFYDLNEKLHKEIAIPREKLPGKKVLKNSKFLEQRQHDLEVYLQTMGQLCKLQIPTVLVEFLDLHKYDVVFLLQKLALHLAHVSQATSWTFTILELHAISSRMLLPCPAFEQQNSAYHFSNVLDFCTQLEHLKIVPSKQSDKDDKEEILKELISPIGTSNILPSTLTFDLSPFTSVKSLEICGIVPQNITKCDSVKATATHLTVNNTRVQNVQQILLPESIHETFTTDQVWTKVKECNFGRNDIWTIDKAMSLVPNVEEVHLNDNCLRNISNLRSLHYLNHLNLSGNLIESCSNWHYELGNISILNLSFNKLKSLAGLSRIRSLRTVDLSWNQIESFDEIDEIAQLPVIENVGLNGNVIASQVDYRTRVLARFGDKCSELILDNEKCSQSEVEIAGVLSVLRQTKVG